MPTYLPFISAGEVWGRSKVLSVLAKRQGTQNPAEANELTNHKEREQLLLKSKVGLSVQGLNMQPQAPQNNALQ